MRYLSTPAIAPLLLIAAAAVMSAPAISPATATPAPAIRYATPAPATGADCSKSKPCAINTAYNEAPAGATVVVGPGEYGSETAPINLNLENTQGHVNAGGSPTRPPVIYTAENVDITGNGSRLHNLTIFHSNAGVALTDNQGATIDAVTVDDNVAGGITCAAVDASIIDSACIVSGHNGTGFALSSSDQITPLTETATLRNDTFETVAPNSTGILLNPGSNTSLTVAGSNLIVHGSAVDIEANAHSGGTANIDLTHSDFATTDAQGAGTDTIPVSSTNITRPPAFTDANGGHYEEAVGSPTIDKGGPVPASDTDLDGRPRDLGKAADIGAYELPVKPIAGTLAVVAKTVTAGRVTLAVDPEGYPTSVVLRAVSGSHHAKSATKSAGHGNTSKIIVITIHGLKAHTHYKVYAVATSHAGHATTSKKSLTTKKKPKHHKKKP